MKKTILRSALRTARAKLPNHPEYNCFPHWSFIVQHNKILEYGMNHSGAPPIHLGYGERLAVDGTPKTHSEFAAWNKAKGILSPDKPFEVINIRLNRRGMTRLAAPCSCCFNFLTSIGCSVIYFSTEVGWSKTC